MPVDGIQAVENAYGRMGDSIPRVEDQRLLTGKGSFTDDFVADDALHAVFVRSPHAHAKIRSIDATAALSAGAVTVFTGSDLVAAGVKPILNPRDSLGVGYPSFDDNLTLPPWHALAVDKVRHVGEALALVMAPTEHLARAAADSVIVEYDVLPAVTDVAVADASGAAQVWDDLPGNRLFAIEASASWSPGAASRAMTNRRAGFRCISARRVFTSRRCGSPTRWGCHPSACA
jgi:carbon-monoxide dehydrogenase large subunit